MQTLPEVIVQEKNKLATPSAWFVLLDIVLGDALTLYLCSNTENVTFKGRVYEAFPFNLEPTKQTAKGEIPSVTLKVANVTQIIQGYLEDLDGAVGATVIVRVVNSAYLSEDYSELEMTFGVLGSEADAEWVSFHPRTSEPLEAPLPPPSLHGLALQLDLQGGRMQLCGHSRELRPLLRHLRQGDAELREIRRPPGPQPEGMEDRMTIPAPRAFTYVDLLGKSFQYGGRGPEAYDCYGLCIELRRRAGLPMPEGYLSCRDFSGIDSRLRDGATRFALELPAPQPFCLATFRLHPRYTSHIGFVLQDSLRFVHIMQRMRVTVERLDAPEWRDKITGYFEVKHESH